MSEEESPNAQSTVAGYFVRLPVEYVEPRLELFNAWQLIINNKRILLIFAVIGFLVGVGSSFLVTKRYKSEVVVSVVEAESGNSLLGASGAIAGLSSLAGIKLPGDDNRDRALAILRSRTLINQFLSNKNLMPVLFPKTGGESGSLGLMNRFKQAPTQNDAYDKFSEDVYSVIENSRTGLISVEIIWTDPLQAAEWANDIVGHANELMRRNAIAVARKNRDFLNRELTQTSAVDLRDVIFNLLEQQINQIMIANVRSDYAFEIIDSAVAADLDKPMMPNRTLFALFGLSAGLLLGFSVLLVRGINNA